MTKTETMTNASTMTPTAFRNDEVRRIVATAIESEMAAYAFYSGAAGKASDRATKTLFESFATDKLGHRKFLENYLAADFSGVNFGMVNDYKVTDSLETPRLSPGMKPLDSMVLAIRKEHESVASYTQLAESTTDAGKKKMYANLASIAQSHKSRLEDIYTNMAYPEAW